MFDEPVNEPQVGLVVAVIVCGTMSTFTEILAVRLVWYIAGLALAICMLSRASTVTFWSFFGHFLVPPRAASDFF